MVINNIGVWTIRISLTLAAIIAGFIEKQTLSETFGIMAVISFLVLRTEKSNNQ